MADVPSPSVELFPLAASRVASRSAVTAGVLLSEGGDGAVPVSVGSAEPQPPQALSVASTTPERTLPGSQEAAVALHVGLQLLPGLRPRVQPLAGFFASTGRAGASGEAGRAGAASPAGTHNSLWTDPGLHVVYMEQGLPLDSYIEQANATGDALTAAQVVRTSAAQFPRDAVVSPQLWLYR